MKITEIWRKIEGFDYEVSNLGRVRSLGIDIYHKGKILKPINKHGYLSVGLCKEGCKPKHFQVHRLVATAFIPNPNNLPFINHKDENPLNNCVDNLEWCTPKYNVNYGHGIEKMKASKCKPVVQKFKGTIIGTFPSILKAAEGTNLNFRNISACLCGRQKTCGGFEWAFA